MRSSYSQNNTYIACPTHWKWLYKDKLKTPFMSSALLFGSAVDDAVMACLDNKENFMDVFYSRWTTARGYGKNAPDITIFDNERVIYKHNKDFDRDVLKQEHIDDMTAWAKQLRVIKAGEDPIDLAEKLIKTLKNPYKKLGANQLKYINRCCWVSLKATGEILIQSFIDDFKPKITKVHATQIPGELKDDEKSDLVFGYLDFVAEIEGYDKPIIFDLKTAARPYSQSRIDLTDQLTLYYAMAGEKYNTDLVGYVVLSKAINKTSISTCSVCGHVRAGLHRKCDNVVNGKRCNGAWDKKVKLEPEVQVLIQKKTEEQKKDLLKNYQNIMLAMKKGIIYKNHDKCTNWYGDKCPYYNACHKNDTSGLVNK